MKASIYSLFCTIGMLLSMNMPQHLYATPQTPLSWQEYLEQLSEEGISDEQLEVMYDELQEIENNPFDLNTVTAEELTRLPFLDAEKIRSICLFLDKNRPLYSVYELRNVPLLDFRTVQLLLPFFKAEITSTPSTPKHTFSLRKGKHDVQIRADKVFPKRDGYRSLSDSILRRYPNRVYQGEDFYHSIRYAYRIGRQLEVGMTAEKDAGEPFFKNHHPKGYDHYGGYLELRDMGAVQSVVLGDFRLNLGQGLILSNNFFISKSIFTTITARSANTLRRHASTAEANFFRGVAGSVRRKNITLTAFVSNKKIDTNIAKDSVSFTSIKNDGLHRTTLEISKKRNTRELVTGGAIQLHLKNLSWGVNLLHNRFNLRYSPRNQYYNTFYFRGKENLNISTDYSYRLHRFALAGETAMSKNGSFATVNSVSYRHNATTSFSLLYRRFGRSYHALYGNAFGNNNHIQNEHGWYLGGELMPTEMIKTSFYIDLARFPEPKYGINTASGAKDFFIRNEIVISPQIRIDSRYRLRQREKNEKFPDGKTTTVLPNNLHKLFLQAQFSLSEQWSGRTTIDYAIYKTKYFPHEKGRMFSQLISWNNPSQTSAHLFVGYFKTDSYNTRVYSRERSVTTSFFMPSFYGTGIRYSLATKHLISKTLTLSSRICLTEYFDRGSIGSSLEKINASHRWDAMLHIRWIF